jgi:hypothetical protein
MAEQVTYPAEFRCAQITPYRIAVDMGVLRTPMDSGLPRQRRLYRTMPHAFQLEFVMTVVELGDWQRWVNIYAYDYFTMGRLETYFAGMVGEISSPHSVRFTGNLEIDNPVYGWVRVRVPAELDPLQPFPGPVEPTNLWVVGGFPQSVITNWVIGGFPQSIITDWIIAGTPAFPAAYL